jgi:hypothetical protein
MCLFVFPRGQPLAARQTVRRRIITVYLQTLGPKGSPYNSKDRSVGRSVAPLLARHPEACPTLVCLGAGSSDEGSSASHYEVPGSEPSGQAPPPPSTRPPPLPPLPPGLGFASAAAAADWRYEAMRRWREDEARLGGAFHYGEMEPLENGWLDEATAVVTMLLVFRSARGAPRHRCVCTSVCPSDPSSTILRVK